MRTSEIILAKSSKIKGDFSKLKRTLPQSERDVLYFSDHLFDRMAERHLINDTPFVFNVAKWFLRNEFKNSTWCNREYRIEYKKLKIGITIKTGIVSQSRHIVVTTAYENDLHYEVDQVIILK